MGRAIIGLAGALIFASNPALALSCSPKDVTARILKSANPNDVHPDWKGGSNIGTAWTLEASGRLQRPTGTYLKGDLLSPRGGTINRGVFVLLSEWDCSN